MYAVQGVDPAHVDDWTVPDLLMGLLAECCYVPLPDIVAEGSSSVPSRT